MTTRFINGLAYRKNESQKKLANGHHKNARGGHRDYQTAPIPKNEGKTYHVDRAIKPGNQLGPPTKAPQGVPRDQTARSPDLPDTVKSNEAGTVGSGKNLMLIGGLVVAAGLIYYYYS